MNLENVSKDCLPRKIEKVVRYVLYMYGLGRDAAGGELANRERCDIVVKNSLRHRNGYALTKFAFKVICSKKNEKQKSLRKKRILLT